MQNHKRTFQHTRIGVLLSDVGCEGSYKVSSFFNRILIGSCFDVVHSVYNECVYCVRVNVVDC